MGKLKSVLLLVLLVFVAGCAKKAENVAATYISPLVYQSYDCDQIALEMQAISNSVATLSGAQNRKRTGDTVATTAAVIIFWPAAFLVGGNDEQTAQLARHKGELEALRQAATQKQCNIEIQEQPAPVAT